MGFFENLSKGISDFGQSTIQKGKDVANVAKFGRMIADEEKTMSRLFEQLGRKYYDLCGEEPAEEFVEFIAGIRESQEKILSYQESIKELQGITKCEKCGADVPSGARFCPECGAEVIVETPEEENADPMKPARRYCTECGALLLPDSRFCTACGKKVEQEMPVPAEPVTAKSAAESAESVESTESDE